VSNQLAYVIKIYSRLGKTLPTYILDGLRAKPALIVKAVTLAENLSDLASLSFKKPLPIMLHEDNTQVEVLMEFNDGIDTSCYKKIAPPRNHGVDKLVVMEEHDRVLCELGVQRKMGPDEKPQNVMETVFTRAKVTSPDGKIIPGWHLCRDPTNSLNKDTKNVDIAGYQLTDRIKFSSCCAWTCPRHSTSW
jgi:hypothetical protein